MLIRRSTWSKLLAVVGVAVLALLLIGVGVRLAPLGADGTSIGRPDGEWFAARVLVVGVLGGAFAVVLVLVVREIVARLSPRE
jgi:hypothetical protein